VIGEHPDTPAAAVAAAVARGWGVAVTGAEHLPLGAGAWHWSVGDDTGPQWFATLHAVESAEDRQARLASYDAAARLARRLSFVVAPVHTRDGRVAVDLAPGRLLTLTPLLEGDALGHGAVTDDAGRSVVANMMGDLHRQRRLRHLPTWRPRIGRHGRDRRRELLHCLENGHWSGGPWSGPAGRLVNDAAPVLRQAVRRFTLLGAAVSGGLERWVVSHGRPDASNIVRTPDGHRLVDWGALALAPRERDLRLALADAESGEPWFSYLEAGGVPEPLAPDALELFALEQHLTEVTEHTLLFAGRHGDGPDERRCFGELERELGALLGRWGGGAPVS
jgi:spectinomycin phosphotransferase